MEHIDSNLIKKITVEILKELGNVNKDTGKVSVGVSSRHVHLSPEDVEQLFGKGYELKVLRNLSQPNQFAAEETVDLIGKKGIIEKVRVLGPTRKETQIEIAKTDAVKLGLNPPVKSSGELDGTPGIIIRNGDNCIKIDKGVILAERHIHMTCKDADQYNVSNGEIVRVEVDGSKGGIFNNVAVRVSDSYSLDLHIDTDDANAFALRTGDYVKII